MSALDFCTPKKTSQEIIKKITIPPSPYMKKIGYGTGVAVYELERSPAFNKFRSPWAIKKVLNRACKVSPAIQTRLKNEAETLRKLVHPNVVGFRAFLESKDGKSILAMEECTTCLGDLIEDRGDNDLGPFSPFKIIKVSLDVVQALNYLHNTALLMHCDLKSYNVLINGDFNICKLCDFGVCLPVTKEGNVDTENAPGAEYTGTRSWSAPEVLGYNQDITTKADIYSFGLIIWEMIALCPPVTEDQAFNISECSDMQPDELDSMIEQMSSRTRPPLPTNVKLGDEYTTILQIFYCCTEADKNLRPAAVDLLVMLNELSDKCLV